MENLKRLNEIFPKSTYVKISKYDPAKWEDIDYDSKFDDKSPLTRWKTNPLDFEQAYAAAQEGYRIGWIIPEGYVCVDIDNEDNENSSDCVERILFDLKMHYSYNRTFRGLHLIFKDNNMSSGTDAVTKCSLGITVDHRANGRGYIILPTNDPHRMWGEWLEREEIQNIPFFLRPMMLAKNNITTFIGMSAGEGRNTELFKWRTKLLQTNKLLNEEIKQSLELINNYLFETPMDESEMNSSVLKERKTDESQRASGEKIKLNALEKPNIYNDIANRIVNEYDMMCVGYKQFYIFDKTYYRPMKEIDVERIIHYNISQNLNAIARQEIMKFLAVKTLVDPEEIDKVWNKIAVGNGILDIVTGELTEPDRNEKNTIAIPWNYNPDPVRSPKIDEFMNSLARNKDGTVNITKVQFLYQIAGYCLLKKNYFGKFFIYQGGGGTGKSTFQDLIVKMVSESNRSRVSLDKMDQDYYLAMLMSKLVNIDDDAVDGRVLENTGRFKSLVTGNEITVRQIFREPITFKPFVTPMFSCNKLPRILDKTSGLYRRLVIIELNNKVENPDPLFLEKLTKLDMEYFLYMAVYWVGVALREGHFRISQTEQELLRKFKCRQSSLNEWLSEENIKLKDIYKHNVNTLYALYIDWATTNNYKKLPSKITFREDICALYNVEIDYLDDIERSDKMIFSRRIEPSYSELDEMPF